MNPFTKLKRAQTQKLLMKMQQIANAKEDLPDLQGWLEKRQPHMPYSWQKRWVIVKGGFLLWTDRQKSIHNPKDSTQRKEFGTSVNLMLITEIGEVSGKKNGKKFVIKLRDGAAKRTEYMFRCATPEDAAFWRKSLRKHQKHLQSLLSYLGTKENC